MQQIDLTKLQDVELKALIYDEQTKMTISNSNIKAVESELVSRYKATMAEDKKDVQVVGDAVELTEETKEGE